MNEEETRAAEVKLTRIVEAADYHPDSLISSTSQIQLDIPADSSPSSFEGLAVHSNFLSGAG